MFKKHRRIIFELRSEDRNRVGRVALTKEKLRMGVDNDFDYIHSRSLAMRRTWQQWEFLEGRMEGEQKGLSCWIYPGRLLWKHMEIMKKAF